MQKIRKGDTVMVIAGKNKGQQGTVLRVDEDKVVVDGINMVKRHTRANPRANSPGGIVDKPAPLHISNVGLFNPITNKADRVGFKVLADGKKVRIFKSNGEQVDI